MFHYRRRIGYLLDDYFALRMENTESVWRPLEEAHDTDDVQEAIEWLVLAISEAQRLMYENVGYDRYSYRRWQPIIREMKSILHNVG